MEHWDVKSHCSKSLRLCSGQDVEGSACLSVECTDQTEVGLNTKILIIFFFFFNLNFGSAWRILFKFIIKPYL